MNRRLYYAVGAVLLLAFAGFSLSAFQESLTPYVSFDQARAAQRAVQVAGDPIHAETRYDRESEILEFTLRDAASGDRIRVHYGGLKPGNFDDATSVVAVGRFNPRLDVLEAHQILVKCPSKYQGIDGEPVSPR